MDHRINRIAGTSPAYDKAEAHRTEGCASIGCVSREQTVGEHIDAKINEAERTMCALRDLKSSLPGSYLASGVSRLGPLGRIA
jgi:hypothetical protein